MIERLSPLPLAAVLALLPAPPASAADQTGEAPMLAGDTAATGNGWTPIPLVTVSETVKGYTAPGILDGIAAFPRNGGFVRALVNHELSATNGYPYFLANGTSLTGARVSFFDIQRTTLKVNDAGLAYDTAYDRHGALVTSAAQINEAGDPSRGFDRFCSSQGIEAGTYGFVDDLYITNEETSVSFGHAHGGSFWILDVAGGAIWAAPSLGRGTWENATPVESGDPGTVALLLGDDSPGAPLYLYLGEKDALGDGSFLDRNGLAVGQLWVWKTDNGDATPQQFNGTGAFRSGFFVPIQILYPAQAGQPGYDDQGYLDDTTQRALATSLGAFLFSRPEDLHTNPSVGTQVVFASTGRGSLFPADTWGDLYIADFNLSNLAAPRADLTIVHDADDLAVPDSGIRSPDNLVWASDGYVYVNEDRSTEPASLFGAATGIEASLWQLDPADGGYLRVAEMDRSAIAPSDATDSAPADLGNWESSGVLDVTGLFDTLPGETLLLTDIQAHSITNGSIGGSTSLVQGGQLLLLSNAR